MPKIMVQKYGGSSVSDIPSIQKVARRITQTVDDGWQVVVVVSAMGNTTNELLSLASQVCEEPKRRELDLLISVGERVSMTLLAMAVQDLGYAAQSFTGSQSGILTDDNHASAKIIEVRPNRIQDALENGNVVIVAGFQGVSTRKEVTTLGRGGSDATAVALAAALGAEFCEICSDVDGVYTADPRVVTQATKLESVGVDELLMISSRGAKVLQAEALELAQKLGIQLHANATSKPSGEGTHIRSKSVSGAFIVALEAEIAWFQSVELSALQSYGPYLFYLWFDDGANALVHTKNIHFPLSEIAKTDIALLSIMSTELCQNPQLLGEVLAFIRECTVVHYQWISKGLLSVVVSSDNLDYLQSKVHELLLSS